ncbi:MAG: hypothetical protein ACKVOT_14210 [Polaromonas sp.]
MRQPINVELRALKTPRERVWEAMLTLSAPPHRGSFTKTAVQDYCEPMVTWTGVDDYFKDLEKAGYLKRVGGSASAPGVVGTPIEFELTQRPGVAPRVSDRGAKVTQGSGTEAMWRVMKILPTFDYRDVAEAATLGDLVISAQTAKSYVVHLARAGYLATVRPSKPGTPARHRLERNTGMHAPCITRLKVVFDRNTGEFAELQTAQEVCDGLE